MCLAFDNWTATLGTNEVNRFHVYSFGKAQSAGGHPHGRWRDCVVYSPSTTL